MIIVFLAYKLLKIDYKMFGSILPFEFLRIILFTIASWLGDILGSLGKTTPVKTSIF